MKATVYHGAHDVRLENVPDPTIRDPKDAIVRVTRAAICGSDLWFYRGVSELKQLGAIQRPSKDQLRMDDAQRGMLVERLHAAYWHK